MKSNYSNLDNLVVQYQQTNDIEIQKQIIHKTREFVAFIAKKFQYRGESLSDIIQVGSIGLLKAINNYDPTVGTKFVTYATATIIGEIKHHFRDNKSVIKIPRRLQEMYSSIQTTIRTMSLTQKKSPNVTEIAKIMKISEDDVLNCLIASESYRSLSLDAPLDVGKNRGHETISLMEAVNNSDHDISDIIINREGMKKAMENLNKNEKKVVYFTYYLNLNQAQIAMRMHFSQAHVSRILINSLDKLKRALKR
ncbi:MAG: sigma-70 family RNA polymerase sigma factor [Candidatus Margulisiibacteriota bacterium]